MTETALQNAQINHTVQAIQEAVELSPDYQEIDKNLVNFYASYTMLTQTQKIVLINMVKNLVSESTQTDTDLARQLGIHYNTVYYCRANPQFQEALAQISIDLIRGKTNIIIQNLFEQSKSKTSAAELLLKLSGLYIPKLQSQVLHARADDFAQIKTSVDLLGKVCRSLHRIGYTKDRLMQELDEVWTKLEDENAF